MSHGFGFVGKRIYYPCGGDWAVVGSGRASPGLRNGDLPPGGLQGPAGMGKCNHSLVGTRMMRFILVYCAVCNSTSRPETRHPAHAT